MNALAWSIVIDEVPKATVLCSSKDTSPRMAAGMEVPTWLNLQDPSCFCRTRLTNWSERYVGATTPASLTSLRLVLVSSTTTPRRPYGFWFTFLSRDSHFKGLHLAFATKKALSAHPIRLQSTWGELRSQRWPSKYYHVGPKSSRVIQSPDVGFPGEGYPQVRQVMQMSRPWNSWRLLSTLPTAGRGIWAT